MERILLTLITCIALASGALSQSAGSSVDSSARLAKDFNRVSDVVHVRILNVRLWKSRNQRDMLGPAMKFDINLVTCQVVDSFKGKKKKGQTFEVYMTADKLYRPSFYKGEKVFFLGRFYDWNNKRWVYSGLESTWRDYSEEVITEIKRIIK